MPPRNRAAALCLALALVASACSVFVGEDTTTTTAAPVMTTTTTTIAFPDRATTSTTIGAGVDPDVAVALQAEVAALIRQAEAIRGLQFVEEPAIDIVAQADFDALLDAEVAPLMEAAEADELVFRLLGMLGADDDLEQILRDAYSADYAGFFDADGSRLVLSGATSELTATDRAALFHEIVHALADQYFAVEAELAAIGSRDSDAAVAFEALAEGDATYFQFVYVQGLSPAEQAEIARDTGAVPGAPVVDAPVWVLEDLAFPYEAGLDFVEQLVGGGGIAAVDRAYLDPPISTEQVLHPERFRIGEVLRPLPEVDVALEGYTPVRTGALGEWGLRLWLRDTLSPGVLTQTADGWGADAVVALRSGGDVAFAYTYKADSEEDAIEVALALVEHTRVAMAAGDGIEVDGGILFDEGGPWVFIDRIGDGLIYVAATDSAAGRELRTQLVVP